MFSIVIPLYNKYDSFRRCLQSISQQTYRNFEVIIVDDGSVDCSASILNEFEFDSVTLFTQSNSGVSVARNVGISLSSGTYVVFLDADDEMIPCRLSVLNEFIRKNNFPEVIGCNFYIQENGKRRVSLSLPRDGGALCEPLSSLEFVFKLMNSSTTCVRRNILTTEFFPPGVHRGEDLVAWLSILNGRNFFYVSVPCVVINRDAGARSAHSYVNEVPLYFEILSKMLLKKNSQILLLERIGVYKFFVSSLLKTMLYQAIIGNLRFSKIVFGFLLKERRYFTFVSFKILFLFYPLVKILKGVRV